MFLFRTLSLILFCFILSLVAESLAHAKAYRLLDLPEAYKKTKFQFFPIPYIETDPGAGERFGLMPTFLWYDEEDQLITIGVVALTYNPKVVGMGGFAGIFLYPSEKESFEVFIGAAQRFERDYYSRYYNEMWLEEKFDLEVELEYMQDPFERFFGFGPSTPKSNESNFVSHIWYWRGRAAYEVLPKFNVQLEEKWVRLDMRNRAITDLNDAETFFQGNPEVRDSNRFVHRLSLIWDTRDHKFFSKEGHYLESYGLFSHPFYTGYGFEGKKIFTLGNRFTTVVRFLTEQLFDDSIPFYMQHHLGGKRDLRGFVKRRFTGRGRILFDLEERILIKSWHIMKAKFDFSIDPFFSLGQVFNRWGQVSMDNIEPAGGVGFRALIPPSVIGRVDVATAKEGLTVYTTLSYPF